jgi:hypothetical protein
VVQQDSCRNVSGSESERQNLIKIESESESKQTAQNGLTVTGLICNERSFLQSMTTFKPHLEHLLGTHVEHRGSYRSGTDGIGTVSEEPGQKNDSRSHYLYFCQGKQCD